MIGLQIAIGFKEEEEMKRCEGGGTFHSYSREEKITKQKNTFHVSENALNE